SLRSFCWFSCFVVNAKLASNPRFSSPEGAPFCLQITSPYALFAGLKEFFTIKFADGGRDFDLWEFLHSEQISAFLHQTHVILRERL
ncbi:hypothetical protein, partial [Leptospira santarosai]